MESTLKNSKKKNTTHNNAGHRLFLCRTYVYINMLNIKKLLITKTAIHYFYHKVVQVIYKRLHFPELDNILLVTLKLIWHLSHVKIQTKTIKKKLKKKWQMRKFPFLLIQFGAYLSSKYCFSLAQKFPSFSTCH